MLGGIYSIVHFASAIWVIYDVINSKMKKDKQIIWSIVGVVLGLVGALIYYFVEKKK